MLLMPCFSWSEPVFWGNARHLSSTSSHAINAILLVTACEKWPAFCLLLRLLYVWLRCQEKCLGGERGNRQQRINSWFESSMHEFEWPWTWTPRSSFVSYLHTRVRKAENGTLSWLSRKADCLLHTKQLDSTRCRQHILGRSCASEKWRRMWLRVRLYFCLK